MITVAIVTEYNPFHSGHKYQIDSIRERFGSDTRIIALMSGNFTQRGEVAILDKGERAKNAIDNGVNLVLELPFPFSISSAELFAGAAISILDRLGVVDYLAFGSEESEIERLIEYAKNCMSNDYQQRLNELIVSESTDGYAVLCQKAYEITFGADAPAVKMSPNNILALEYIKALTKRKSKIKPVAFLRLGADYNAEIDCQSTHQSATGIRAALLSGEYSALEYVPESTKRSILFCKENGTFPVDNFALSSAIISSIRLNSPLTMTNIHDVGGGLYNRLFASAQEANNLDTLISLTETKKYTTSRIRRAIWYSFLGVTSSDVKEAPEYTQVLGMDEVGRTILKEIGKQSSLPIVTKPSNVVALSSIGRRQLSNSQRADSVFELCKPSPGKGDASLRFSPYVKK